jgi:hypothetical protein
MSGACTMARAPFRRSSNARQARATKPAGKSAPLPWTSPKLTTKTASHAPTVARGNAKSLVVSSAAIPTATAAATAPTIRRVRAAKFF